MGRPVPQAAHLRAPLCSCRRELPSSRRPSPRPFFPQDPRGQLGTPPRGVCRLGRDPTRGRTNPILTPRNSRGGMWKEPGLKQQKQSAGRCRGKAQMGVWAGRATSSWREEEKEKTGVSKALRERKGVEHSGQGRQGGRGTRSAAARQETRHVHAGRHRENLKALRGAPRASWIRVYLPRGLAGAWLPLLHSFQVTASC